MRTTSDFHSGFVQKFGVEKETIMFMADITEPTLITWIRANVCEGEEIEIEVDKVS
jgi:hypothetical protein